MLLELLGFLHMKRKNMTIELLVNMQTLKVRIENGTTLYFRASMNSKHAESTHQTPNPVSQKYTKK